MRHLFSSLTPSLGLFIYLFNRHCLAASCPPTERRALGCWTSSWAMCVTIHLHQKNHSLSPTLPIVKSSSFWVLSGWSRMGLWTVWSCGFYLWVASKTGEQPSDPRSYIQGRDGPPGLPLSGEPSWSRAGGGSGEEGCTFASPSGSFWCAEADGGEDGEFCSSLSRVIFKWEPKDQNWGIRRQKRWVEPCHPRSCLLLLTYLYSWG